VWIERLKCGSCWKGFMNLTEKGEYVAGKQWESSRPQK
jgi:hypothetical protein